MAQAGKPSALLGALVSLTLLAAAVPGAAAAASGCTIVGTPGADRLVGTQGADGICGRGGADTLIGLGTGDWLSGGPGADTLYGGSGRDLLEGGPGNDRLAGGRGNDELRGGSGRNRCRDATVIATRGCSAPKPRFLSPSPPPPPPPSLPLPFVEEPFLDAEGPSLQSLEFSTENVEIATGDWWVDLSLSAWDESGIESVTVTVEGPGGIWREFSFGPAPAQPAELREKVEVPASTPVGEYRVTAVTLVDSLGNSISHDLPWLAEYGMDDRFEVYDGPDREAPNLAGISFGQGNVVDTGKGPVTVEVPIEVTDPGSGVDWVRLRIAHPTSKRGNERIYSSIATLDSGTAREGTWLATFELPHGATAGFYPVDELALEDFDDHRRYFVDTSLEDSGFPGGFTQVGTADTTRPKITSFSIEPQVLHTAAGERKLEVEIGIADDLSGVNGYFDPVSDIGFWLTPPDWPVSWGMGGSAPQLVTGTYLDGSWHIDRWLQEEASFGTWTVRWITVTDRAGNTTRLEDGPLEGFEAEGWDLSFENLP